MPEFQVKWVAETGSTNSDMLAAARQGKESGAVLVAEYQSAGRGRRGRSWYSVPGSGLLFSVLLRPRLVPEEAHLVTTALALSAAEACHSLTGVRPSLKWPNDLTVGDRKLAGLLAESVVAGTRLEALVVGMGLNVRMGAAPQEAADTAVALEDLSGAAVDRQELLEAILGGFSLRLEETEGLVGRAALMEEARRESATLGRRVSVELADGVVREAVASGLDEQGALVLDDGTRIVVGDVVHLRSA